MEDIKVCKLVDGSFAIGKQNREGDIVEGLELIMMPNQTGGMSVALVPVMYPLNRSKEDIVIQSNKILFCIEADDEMISKYLEATSGLVIPKSNFMN